MSEYGRPKSAEQLDLERSQIEETLGRGLYLPEALPDYSPEDFIARSRFAARALTHIRHDGDSEFRPEVARMFIGALNSLQRYVQNAETTPSTTFLRAGQIPIMRNLADYFEYDAFDHQGGHVVLPTSVGKTVIFSELIHATGLRSLIVVPTKELLFQTRQEFEKHAAGRHLDIGFVFGDEKRPGEHVTITTYPSLTNNLKAAPSRRVIRPSDYPLVVYDEVQDLLGEQRRKAVAAFPHAVQIGFTATDKYSPEKQVADVLPIEVVRMDIIEGQEKKLVAPHHTVIVHTPTDMRDVPVASTGEYAQDILFRTIDTVERNQVVIDTWKALFESKKAIAYCGGIHHARHLAEQMRQQGIAAASIDGTMSTATRKDILERLKLGGEAGGIDIVTNDRVLGKGFSEDTLEVGLMVAPTLSVMKLMQNGGRVTRLWKDHPDKVGYIVQFIDENYAVPPVIYAEDEASGFAQHGWEDFEFPELDIDSVQIPNVDVIADPQLVQELAEAYADKRNTAPQEPPEGWLHLDEIAERYQTSRARVYPALGRFEAALDKVWKQHEQEDTPTDDLMVIDDHKGKFMKKAVDASSKLYLSPELVSEIEQYIKQYKVVPSPLWRTADQIAALYGFASGTIKQYITPALRNAYPDLWGKFVPDIEEGKSQRYFSPEFIAILAAEKKWKDYSLTPPETWFQERAIQDWLGSEAFDVATSRIEYRFGGSQRYGRLVFETPTGEEVYCSPKYSEYLRDLLDPYRWNVSMNRLRSLDELAAPLTDLEITARDLEVELERAIRKEPGLLKWECGKFFDREENFVYFCVPAVAAHIQEQAIRTKVEKTRSEQETIDLLAEKEAARAQNVKGEAAAEQEIEVREPVAEQPTAQTGATVKPRSSSAQRSSSLTREELGEKVRRLMRNKAIIDAQLERYRAHSK